jgi:hypothetical protein
MNQAAHDEDFDFDDETVAESLQSAKVRLNKSDDDDFEIEVVDDTPEQDRGKPRRADNSEAQVPDDDELQSYSEGVQKRIKQLKFEYHEERRRKEEAARLQEEALRYASRSKLKTKSSAKPSKRAKVFWSIRPRAGVAAELDKAKAAYKAAYELGDSDALIEAQERLSALQAEKMRYDSYRPQPRQAQTPAPEYTRPQPQPPRPDEKAVAWAQKNTWFERDSEMTGYAYGLHEKLIKSGVDPRSDEYYNQIDRAVRRVFPDRFDGGKIEEVAPQRQAGNVVAPAARSGKLPRKVQLTSTQVALAKRLGLSNEQYAAQLMKEMNR